MGEHGTFKLLREQLIICINIYSVAPILWAINLWRIQKLGKNFGKVIYSIYLRGLKVFRSIRSGA